jgi:hypothetical protein
MTGVQRYIKSLQNYKDMTGGIESAIVLAETVLLAIEEQQLKDAYNIGYKDAQANHINDADNYVEQLKLNL